MKTKHTYTITITREEAEKILLDHFGHAGAKVSWTIQEVGGDPLDRYPGVDTVTEVHITYEEGGP